MNTSNALCGNEKRIKWRKRKVWQSFCANKEVLLERLKLNWKILQRNKLLLSGISIRFFTLYLCIYRQAQEKQWSLNPWDPLSFPQGKRKLLIRPRVLVTAAGSCSVLELQTDTLGRRIHHPTPYRSMPEILPTEVFCLCNCAGKQGGVSVLQCTKGESTDGGSALGCGGEAPPASPPRAAPEQSSTLFPTELHPKPGLGNSLSCTKKSFSSSLQRARQPSWEPRAAEQKCLASNSWEEQSSWAPKK